MMKFGSNPSSLTIEQGSSQSSHILIHARRGRRRASAAGALSEGQQLLLGEGGTRSSLVIGRAGATALTRARAEDGQGLEALEVFLRRRRWLCGPAASSLTLTEALLGEGQQLLGVGESGGRGGVGGSGGGLAVALPQALVGQSDHAGAVSLLGSLSARGLPEGIPGGGALVPRVCVAGVRLAGGPGLGQCGSDAGIHRRRRIAVVRSGRRVAGI